MFRAGIRLILVLSVCGSCGKAAPVSSAPKSSSPGLDAAQPAKDCAGAGRYEVGKEGGYRPCCAGLQEVPTLAAVEQGEPPTRTCTASLPLRIYACVRGRCGDGECEPGEAERCGCAADCPSAAWGPADDSPSN